MAFTCHVGSFAANTSTGSQTVDTGTGVQGKAVLFWGQKITAAGDAPNLDIFIGCATSSTEEWAVWAGGLDASATQAGRRFAINNACIEIRDSGATSTANGRADFTSFGSGGSAGQFTINWSDAPTAAYIIHYMFLGGTDLTNAKAGSWAGPAAAGTQDITSVGFQPDFVMTAGGQFLPNASDTVFASIVLGAATSSSARSCATFLAESGAGTWDSYRYQSTSLFYNLVNDQSTYMAADFTSFLSNGFRLNWTTFVEDLSGGSDFYLALKGGQYQVGTFTTQTGTGNFDVSTAFQGTGALFFSALSANATHTQHAKFSLGSASSSSARGALGLADNETTEFSDTRTSTSKIYENISAGTPTVDGEMDFVSFNASNMTLNQTDADASGLPVQFILFGSTAGAAAVPRNWGYVLG
jgi:hypothetical protein